MDIVRTKSFDKDMLRIGASESDVEALISDLAANPQSGDRIEGLKGVRKIRFGLPSRNIGKRGGGRAIYLLIEIDETAILIMAFAKNEQSDLSPRQRKAILSLLKDVTHG